MAQLLIELPDTLHYQLEGLARREGVQLNQYVLYILTRQVSSTYMVQVIPEEAVAQQEADYVALRQQWGKVSPGQVEEVLARREPIEPEPELKSEVVEKLQRRINEKKSEI